MKALDFRYFPAYTRRGEAVWSPNGRYLGLEVGDLGQPELHNHIIQVYDFETGKVFNASGNGRSFSLQLPLVRRRRRHHYVAYQLLNAQIFRLDVLKKEARQLSHFPKMEVNQLSFAADGRTIAFSASTPDWPQEIYVGDINFPDKARRLTDIHPELAKIWLGETEEITWKVRRRAPDLRGISFTRWATKKASRIRP